MDGTLFLVFLDFHGLEVFGLENLTAIQAFDVFHAGAAGNHLSTGMVANGLHKQRLDEVYFNRLRDVVKPPAAAVVLPRRNAPASGRYNSTLCRFRSIACAV